MKRNLTYIICAMLVVLIILFQFVPQLSIQNRPAVTTGFPETIQGVLPSVVHIMCDRWQGSGVALTEDIVVTARHVVEGLNYTITLNDGTVVKGVQAITHKDYDIGFIQVDKQILKPAKFGSIKDCVLGQRLFAIGSPFGFDNFNSVTAGILSSLKRDFDSGYTKGWGWSSLFQTDTTGEPGNSGCPIFTSDGIVRGILVGGMSNGIVYCVPADVFQDDINSIILLFTLEKYRIETEKNDFNY